MPVKKATRSTGPRAALDQNEAAEYLGISLSMFKEERRQGRMPYVQASERRRAFLIADLDAWLSARRVQSKGGK